MNFDEKDLENFFTLIDVAIGILEAPEDYDAEEHRYIINRIKNSSIYREKLRREMGHGQIKGHEQSTATQIIGFKEWVGIDREWRP